MVRIERPALEQQLRPEQRLRSEQAPEAPEVAADKSSVPAVASDVDQDDDSNIAFDRMSEEDLLAGIEGLVPPEKNDDF